MKKAKLLMPLLGVCAISGMVLPTVSCSTNNNDIPAPKDYSTDSWETVIDVCNQGYVAFANAYCGATTKDETAAIAAIKAWILEEDNANKHLRTIKITHGSYEAEAHVRLIGVNYDELYESSKHEKAKFTFEFADIIDICAYDVTKDNTWYAEPEGGKPLKSCFLRNYLNDYVFYMLPQEVRTAIKKVNKLSYVFTYKAVGEDYEPERADEVYSPEYLFPLSATEMAQMPEEFQTLGFESNPYVYYSDVEYEYQGAGDGFYHTASTKPTKLYYGTEYHYGYWTRTPGWAGPTLGSSVCADSSFDMEDKFYSVLPVDAGYGVAPCFCI